MSTHRPYRSKTDIGGDIFNGIVLPKTSLVLGNSKSTNENKESIGFNDRNEIKKRNDQHN